MKTPEEIARGILDTLSECHGEETFVSDDYGYYEDALEAISAAIAAERARTEKAIPSVEVMFAECERQHGDSEEWNDCYVWLIKKLKELA